MAEFAQLVISAKTEQLKRAKGDLNETTAAAGRTDRAVDKTGKAFVKTGAQSKTATSAMAAGIKKAHIAVAALATAALGLGVAIKVIAEFETSISKLGAISGATTKQLAQMRDVAKELGSATEFSAGQAADGLTFLAQAGFTAQESIAAIPAVLDLATASGLDLAAAADTASNIMSGFGIAAGDAARVSDVLAAAASSSNTNVSQLGGAMSTVAPIAAALGIELEDTAASIGILSDAGIQGERAGTALRGVLAALAGPTAAATTVLKEMGLTIKDVDPATNDLADVLGKLQGAGLSTADAMTIFGREAASGALVLVKGAKQVGTFAGELEKADGASKDMAETMRNNLGGDIAALQSSLSGLILALGEAGLTAVLRGAIQSMTGLARFMSENVVPAFNALGVALAGIIATQIPALIAGLSLATAGMTAAGIATGVFTAAVSAARIALIALGGPIGLVFGLLGSAAAAWALFGEKTNTAKTATEEGRIALALLNEVLDDFSQVESPAAQGAALGNAIAYKAQASAALEVARAEMLKVAAMNESAEQRLRDGGAVMPFGTNLGDRNLEAKTAIVEGLTLALKDADGRIKLLATTITNQQIPAVTKATKVIKPLTVSVAGAASEVDTLKDELEKTNPVFDKIGDTIGDFIAGGLKDFDSLKDGFKNMLKDMISMAIANPIKLALTGVGGLSGGAANAAGGGVGGGGVSGGGILGGILGKAAGIGSAIGTGFMSSLGGFASGGLSGGFGAIGAQLSATAAGGFGLSSIAASIGAVAAPLLAVVAVFSFFKKKTKELDAGLRVTVDGLDAVVDGFKVIQTKRFWGLSKKVSTQFNALDAAVSGPLNRAVDGLLGGIFNSATALGINAKAFDNFSNSVSISTKGLSEDEAQKEIAEALGGIADDFAGLVPGLSAFKAEGEGASATLSRLSTSLIAANVVLDTIGGALFNISLSGAGAAASLVGMFGGLQNFNTAASVFFDRFFTQQEQLATKTRQLTEVFQSLNTALPETRKEFRSLVEAQDLNTEAGRAMFATLVSLAGQFDAILPSIDSLSNALGSLVGAATEAALGPINEMIASSKSAANIARQSADEFFRLADSLRAAASNIGGVTTTAELATAGQKFTAMLAKAVTGDTAALAGLGAAGGSLATDSAGFATSAVDLKRIEATIRGQLQQGAAVSEALGLGADFQALLFDVNTAALEVTREILASGNVTEDILNEQTEILQNIGQRISDSANLQILTSKNGLGETIAALVDGSGKVVAGLSSEGAQAIAAIQGQTSAIVAASEAEAARVISSNKSTADLISTAVASNGAMTTAQIRTSLAGKASNAKINAVINAVDTNKDGIISASEALAAKAISASSVQASRIVAGVTANADGISESLFSAVDTSKNGIISAIELQSARTIQSNKSVAKLISAEVGRSGNMTAAQIRASLSGKASDAKINAVINAVDSNKDGVVSASEAAAAKTIASVGLSAANQINGITNQSAVFGNAITGQTASVIGGQKLTTKQVSEVAGLQGKTVDITKLVRDAVNGNEILTETLINRLGAGISIAGFGNLLGSNATMVELLTNISNSILLQDARDEAARDAAKIAANNQQKIEDAMAPGRVIVAEISALRDQIENTQTQMGEAPKTIITTTTQEGPDGPRDIIRSIVNPQIAAFQKSITALLSKISSAELGLEPIREAVRDLGGIPSFAKGVRNFAGGLAEINDGTGGEIVNLPNGSQVIPNDLSRRMVDGQRGGQSANTGDDSMSSVAMKTELAELRRVMVSLVKFTKRISDLDRKHDIEGTPPVRAA